MGIADALTALDVDLASVRFTPVLAATLISPDNKPTIVPGQPIRIRWRFDHGTLERGPGTITVRILVGGDLVFQRDGVLVHPFDATTGEQTTTISLPDQNVADRVYQIGQKELKVQVQGDLDGQLLRYEAIRWFHVIPEPIDASWWDWRSDGFEEVPWKTGYTLTGNFVNKSQFATIAIMSAELSEVRAEANPEINPCGYIPVATETRTVIPPGARVPFSFSRLDAWNWLVPGTFTIVGPLSKLYAYAVAFYFTDEYKNQYPIDRDYVCSHRILRLVEVSGAKQAAAVTAFHSANTAIVLTAMAAASAAGWIFTAAITGGLLIGAGVAAGVAAAAGAIAYDPPSPDPNYREPVVVEPIPRTSWPAGMSTPPQLSALRKFLERAARLLALENARTLTRARLMGARLFGDNAAGDLHRQGYLKIEEEMTDAANDLERLLPELQKEIESNRAFDREKLSIWLDSLAQTGLPPAMHEGMIKASLDDIQISQLSALLTQRSLIALVKETGHVFHPLAVSLRNFSEQVRTQRDAVLDGEVCPPAVAPRPVTVSQNERSPDPEAKPRPKPACC